MRATLFSPILSYVLCLHAKYIYTEGGASCVGGLAADSQLNRNGSGYFRGWGAALGTVHTNSLSPVVIRHPILTSRIMLGPVRPMLCFPQAEFRGGKPLPKSKPRSENYI